MLLLKRVVASQPSITFLEDSSFLTLPGASSEKNKSQDSSRKPEAVSVFVGGKGRVSDGICGGSSEKGHVSHCTVLPEWSS